MPRYYMHLRLPDGLGLVSDEHGKDFDSLDRAREEAIAGTRSMLGDDVRAGVLDLRGTVEVVDADGVMVLSLPFADIVQVQTGDQA